LSRRITVVKDQIKGENCSLRRFRTNDSDLVRVLLQIFTEPEVQRFLNREYTVNDNWPKVKKWLTGKINHPVEVWYSIVHKRRNVGYVCFKWRRHFDGACEISTGISKQYRGLKLGFESSRLLVDHIKELNHFRHIVAYVHVKNKKAEANIRKLGFRKSNRLQKTITKEFYGEPAKNSKDRIYDLYSIPGTVA